MIDTVTEMSGSVGRRILHGFSGQVDVQHQIDVRYHRSPSLYRCADGEVSCIRIARHARRRVLNALRTRRRKRRKALLSRARWHWRDSWTDMKTYTAAPNVPVSTPWAWETWEEETAHTWDRERDHRIANEKFWRLRTEEAERRNAEAKLEKERERDRLALDLLKRLSVGNRFVKMYGGAFDRIWSVHSAVMWDRNDGLVSNPDVSVAVLSICVENGWVKSHRKDNCAITEAGLAWVLDPGQTYDDGRTPFHAGA